MGNYDYPVSESVKALFKNPSVNDEGHMSRRSSRGRGRDRRRKQNIQLSHHGFEPVKKKVRVRMIIEEGEEILLSLDVMCLKDDLQTFSQIILGKLK